LVVKEGKVLLVALATGTALFAFGGRAFGENPVYQGPEIFDSTAYHQEVQKQSERAVEQRNVAAGHQFDTCQAGVTAFTSSVHALIRTHCTHCHDVNADIRQGPPFAVADPTDSYGRVERLVNWDNLAQSYLVTKGGNRHCVGYGFDCQTGPDEIMAALNAWWSGGESTCPRLGNFFSDEVVLPAGLPTGADSWVKMRWDLSNIDPSLDGALFEVEAQQFAAPNGTVKGAYRFRKPRLASVLNPVHVKGIRILVNGKFDSFADEYVTVDQTVAAAPIPSDASAPLPHAVLSADPLIVSEDQGVAADKLSLGFDVLQAVAMPPKCKALPLYQKGVVPAINARNCYYCHGGGSQNLPGTEPARSRLSFAGDDAGLCAKLVQRATAWNPQISPLIAYPLKGAFEHPRIIPSVSEVFPGWTNWIAAEFGP
jgi:hypothetical protein